MGKKGKKKQQTTGTENETRSQVLQRHKLEERELQNKMKMLIKGAKKDKEAKRLAEEQGVQLENEMRERHEKELEPFVEEETLVEETEEEKNDVAAAKLAKAQRKRERKKQLEQEKAEQIRLEKLNIVSDREIELEIIQQKLTTMGFSMKEIPSDGNCMFHAIAHQMDQHNIILDASKAPHFYLRELAARYLRSHQDEFEAFITVDLPFDQYCDRLENTQEWGGQVELNALCHALEVPIDIIAAEAPTVHMGTQFASEKTLRLTYHKHYYSLGEHYNAVCATN